MQRHYCTLEDAFLCFASALDTDAGMLDGLMWDYMRRVVAITTSSSSRLGRTQQLDLAVDNQLKSGAFERSETI